MSDVTIVTGTLVDEDTFDWATFLGRSLSRFPDDIRPSTRVTWENGGDDALGLPEIYNSAIGELDGDSIVAFVHDDVYLHDWFLEARLREAVDRYDVVGLAGSVNPDLSEPSWGLKFDADLLPDGWQDDIERSGSVNHFDYGAPRPSWYGHSPKACELIDGLFMAARVDTLRNAGVRFDPQFRFHLYDLDFCRAARAAGLSVGTWPISVTHDSGGGFKSEAFRTAARTYLAKWN